GRGQSNRAHVAFALTSVPKRYERQSGADIRWQGWRKCVANPCNQHTCPVEVLPFDAIEHLYGDRGHLRRVAQQSLLPLCLDDVVSVLNRPVRLDHDAIPDGVIPRDGSLQCGQSKTSRLIGRESPASPQPHVCLGEAPLFWRQLLERHTRAATV